MESSPEGSPRRPPPRRASSPLGRFREAVRAVQRHLAGARSLAQAADKAQGSGEALALYRRACSFGQQEPPCDAPARSDPNRPTFHLMPVRCRSHVLASAGRAARLELARSAPSERPTDPT